MPTLLVFGARNLGRAIARSCAGDGWNVAAVARSRETLDALAGELPAAQTIAADAARADDVERVFSESAARFGSIDLVVSAISIGVPGAPLAEAAPDAMQPYLDTLVPAIFNVVRVAARVLGEQGRGTLVQITGGSARRGLAGRGQWAAAAFATRALLQSGALELRERGVHAALLIVDATIESDKTRAFLGDRPPEATASEDDVVAAVRYLHAQSPRGWTHELQITPRLDRFLP